MTKDRLQKIADSVRDCYQKNDDEGAHVKEDDLMIATLKAIQKAKSVQEANELAKLGLSTRKLKFARYCS